MRLFSPEVEIRLAEEVFFSYNDRSSMKMAEFLEIYIDEAIKALRNGEVDWCTRILFMIDERACQYHIKVDLSRLNVLADKLTNVPEGTLSNGKFVKELMQFKKSLRKFIEEESKNVKSSSSSHGKRRNV